MSPKSKLMSQGSKGLDKENDINNKNKINNK